MTFTAEPAEVETVVTVTFERKPFICRNCRVELGKTDGIRLYMGENAIFVLTVTITCAKCGSVRAWRPVLATETARKLSKDIANP